MWLESARAHELKLQSSDLLPQIAVAADKRTMSQFAYAQSIIGGVGVVFDSHRSRNLRWWHGVGIAIALASSGLR